MIFNSFPTLGRLSTTSNLSWIDGPKLRAMVAEREKQLRGCVGPLDRVMICHGGSAGFVADLLAVWNLGAAAACINPTVTENEKQTLIDFVEPSVVLNGYDLPPTFINKNRSLNTGASPSLDDPALYLFTSGTTGNPKGVEHSFRSLLSRLTLNMAHMGNVSTQRTLCPLPTHFGHGLIGNLLTPLLNGQDVILLDDKSPQGLSKIGEIIDENNITFLSSVPSFWKMVTRLSKPPQKETLQRVHVGSAPLSSDLWAAIGKWCGTDEVFNMYGITETANWIGGTSLSDGKSVDGLIGRVWGGSAMILNTETGEKSPTGDGELLIQTPSLMSGYFRQPELTEAVLINGWFHTGDIGTIDAHGSIRITGRQKSEINRAGMKILPEEIDLLLERHNDIQEVCVFGLPDAISGERVAVACVLKDNITPDSKALQDWMGNLIRREAIPESWFFIDEIPKTDRGKINRNNVRDKCLEAGDRK
ncbi:MAG: class I adenylate-forming enzyme family protein [Pseudomonas marincola]